MPDQVRHDGPVNLIITEFTSFVTLSSINKASKIQSEVNADVSRIGVETGGSLDGQIRHG